MPRRMENKCGQNGLEPNLGARREFDTRLKKAATQQTEPADTPAATMGGIQADDCLNHWGRNLLSLPPSNQQTTSAENVVEEMHILLQRNKLGAWKVL